MMKSITKVALANTLVVVLLISAYALFSISRFHAEAVTEANADLERSLKTFRQLLEEHGKNSEGFRIVDGRLLMGDYLINGNFEVPDKVQEIFGGVATVFMGDRRVSTNVPLADGRRAVGTRLEGPAFEAVFRQGVPFRGEALILGVPYLTYYEPIRGGSGEIIGALFVGKEKSKFLTRFAGVQVQLVLLLLGLVGLFITFTILLGRLSKKLEGAKEAEREFAESLVQNSTAATFVLDNRHRVIIWNRACEMLTGIPAAAMLGTDKPWKGFYDHERPVLADLVLDGNRMGAPGFYDAHGRSTLVPEGLQAERWFPELNGRPRYIIANAAPLRNKQGELVAAIETIEDITEHKEREDQLHKLSLAVEQSANTVVITDGNGDIEYVNPRFTELTGYAAEEVLGRNPRLLQSGATSGEQYRSMWETIRAGGNWRGEFRNRKKNGDYYWESASISPVKHTDGTIKHFIAVKEDITEKKLAEEKIRQTLSLLSATLESTADGILARDLSGKVLTYNRKFVEIWRIPEAVLETRDEAKMRMSVLDQLKHPDEFLELTEYLYRRPDSESCHLVEFKDGRIIERVSKPQIIDNQIVGRVVSFRDITERTRAEVELGKVNRALRTLSACNRALVYATDERSLLLEICRNIVDNGGYRFAWVGYPLADAAQTVRPMAWAGHEAGYLTAIQVTSADSEFGRGPVGTAIRTGAPAIVRDTVTDGDFIPWREEARERGFSSVIALPLACGSTFASLAIYASEPDAFDPQEVELLRELASNLSYGISALRMREEHLKSERALLESEERYRSLIEHIDLGITLIDADFRILMANPSICKTLKKPAQELLTKECFRAFEKREAPCPRCAGRAVLATGKHAISETELVLDDGSRIQARINTFPVFDADGKATRFIEVFQDITEQKRAEAEKRQLEQQLRQAQKMEALGTLAGGLAHDFNNILTAIIGYCSLIERESDAGGRVRHYLEKLLASTGRAAALTRSLLAYSRKQPHDPQPVDLNTIMGKIDTLLSRLLGEDIELAIRPAAGPLTVLADSLQIEQVLMNLATNARDAMPDGGILQIAIGQTELDAEFIAAHGYGVAGGYALITVSDTGSGMDETIRERIFEPFFTTKEVGRGTGLGLSIAYGIIKQHNGYITSYSEPGKGSTFRIYLPLTARATANPSPAVLLPPPPGSETILLVEDDREIRTPLKEILQGEGYTIIEAADGEEALRKFRACAERVQLLILDVIMPKKNGKAVYDEIRASHPSIKAIFMSGYTADILSAKGILEDDLNFIHKPVSTHQLLCKVREVLDQ